MTEQERALFDLRLTQAQRETIAGVLRSISDPDMARAIADSLVRDGRVTRHLGTPTRSGALRQVFFAAGGWVLRDNLLARALATADGDATRAKVDGSLRAMIRFGEVERRDGPNGIEYRLAKVRS